MSDALRVALSIYLVIGFCYAIFLIAYESRQKRPAVSTYIASLLLLPVGWLPIFVYAGFMRKSAPGKRSL